ncbi:MAG: GMC oxidoreductase [Acidimicrobiales bacterium]|nr:GMC oxidoreductase [Acidimicrobiales bacterium]
MPRLDEATTRRLAAVFDRIIPADDFPPVSEGGVFAHLDTLASEPTTRALVDGVLETVDRLDRRARDVHATPVDALDAGRLDGLLAELDWAEREQLVQRAAEAYYGGADQPGARMVGYRAGPNREPDAPVIEPALTTTRFDALADEYDVVVVGAGAGGGVVAQVASEAGERVLLVERGDVFAVDDLGRDHLRNHRSKVFGTNTSSVTGAGPRELVLDGRTVVIDKTHDPRWHDTARTVGGGTRVHQGMAWRFVPDDFHLASRHGVPDDSSLADWPLTYDDLEPHYTWAEHAIGVCGDGHAHPSDGPRSAELPMPPLPRNTEAEVLAAGAKTLGLSTGPVPQAINSVPRDGRARCVQCGECVGFACISGAKNGTFNTVIPRALASGNADLVAGGRAREITVGAAGRVDGVCLVDEDSGRERHVRAGHVVVAAGAIETARLLLASRSGAHPSGLGNDHDQVGRHLQGHVFVSAFGRFDDLIVDIAGPGSTIATGDLRHRNPEVIGGGVLSNESLKLPIVHWRWARHPDAPRWGRAAKDEMRRNYRRTGHVIGVVQEIPRSQNRVTLASRTDTHGVPVVRLEGHGHPETLRTAAALRDVATRWMEASGAADVWAENPATGLTAGTHQAGTCRMGTDPATSVADPAGRVHGHDNLWVADASLHVTNGGVSPSLTVFALAHRVAQHLVGDR